MYHLLNKSEAKLEKFRRFCTLSNSSIIFFLIDSVVFNLSTLMSTTFLSEEYVIASLTISSIAFSNSG